MLMSTHIPVAYGVADTLKTRPSPRVLPRRI